MRMSPDTCVTSTWGTPVVWQARGRPDVSGRFGPPSIGTTRWPAAPTQTPGAPRPTDETLQGWTGNLHFSTGSEVSLHCDPARPGARTGFSPRAGLPGPPDLQRAVPSPRALGVRSERWESHTCRFRAQSPDVQSVWCAASGGLYWVRPAAGRAGCDSGHRAGAGAGRDWPPAGARARASEEEAALRAAVWGRARGDPCKWCLLCLRAGGTGSRARPERVSKPGPGPPACLSAPGPPLGACCHFPER